jgi:eukaryotic-like serine/threonine-protein kinase
MIDRVGRQVGNYRLISLLGQGGFAEVYLGEHIYLRSKAAIKLLNTQLSDKNKEHFLEEARFLVNLIHPHIVRVLDFGLEGETPFLVLDYASHGSLRQLHPAGIPLPLMTVVTYTKQAADALQYAHEQKLIHRDIKPENMLLGRYNEILLSDFGIAVLAQSSLSQSVKEVAGTAAYMAPEQFQGKPRPASDQYALGVVIYEWLCGVHPFKGTFVEVASQHLFVSPPSLQGINPTITPDIEQVVMTALAKDPKQRFASIRAFANALEQASQPSQAPLFLSTSNQSSLIATQIESAALSTEAEIHSDKPSSPMGLNTPSGQPVQSTIAQPPNEAVTTSPQDSSAGSIAIPAQPSQSPQGISRRTVLAGLAVLGSVGVIGGGVVLLEYIRSRTSTTTSITNTTKPPPPASSSGAMFGFNPQHTHVNAGEHILSTANVSRLTQAWATPIEGIIGISSPAVANGMVYVGSFDHHVYGLNAATGRIVWMTPTKDIIYSSPAVANGVVYVGSADSKVYALNASSGHILWTFPTGGGVNSSPAVVDGVVYVGSADSKVYALNASSGHVLWTFPTGGGVNSSPAVVDGVVYVGSFDSKVYAIDASSGKLIWAVPVAGGIFDSPAVDNGIVYIGTQEHSTFYAINVSTGKITWKMPTGDYINSSPAIAGGLVYVGSKDGKLYAFDAFTGKKDWTAFNIQGAEIASSPTIANGVLYVGSWNHNFYALDAFSGTILWNTTTGDGIESSPAVVNGVVYVGSRDHKLYAFKLPAS